jgi:hypothetical protein
VRGRELDNKRRFVEVDGIELLYRILDSDESSAKLRNKAAVLLEDLMLYD